MLVFLIWYIAGVIITIYEMRHDFDVTFGWFVAAFIVGIFGPFMLIKTISRKSGGVIFKKFD